MQCKAKDCTKEALPGKEFCRKDYIASMEEIYLDNSEIFETEEKGILRWLKDFYPETYRNPFTKEHKQVYHMMLELYNPLYKNKLQRQRELIAFRSFAKSSTIFGLFSYLITHNNKDFKFKDHDGKVATFHIKERLMVIFSETGSMAEDFSVNIRDSLSSNPMIRYFYPYELADVKDQDQQWTRRAFKFNDCFVLGLGSGVQIRGKIKNAYRPTLAVYDDIYSEQNTITEERREKISKWFSNASLNSIDDLMGKVLLTGTIVSMDTVLVQAERSDSWETLKFYPMPLPKFREFIKKYLVVNQDRRTCILPFDDVKDKFDKITKQQEFFEELDNDPYWGVTWKERLGLYLLSLKYKDAIEKSSIAGFMQEYFHLPISEELKKFKPEYFQKIPGYWEVKKEFGYNWFVSDLYNGVPQLININIGVDMSSGLDKGDRVAIIVAGIIPDGRVIILESSSGAYAVRDVIDQDSFFYKRIDRILTDSSIVVKKGFVDEIFRLSLKYNPSLIKIAKGGGTESTLIDETRRVLNTNGLYINVVPRIQIGGGMNKFERIKHTLLPYYETMSVWHANGLDNLEYELEFLTKAEHDDEADAEECSVFQIVRPPLVRYDSFGNSGMIEIKKNRLTPYSYGIKPGQKQISGYDWRLN